MAQTMAPDDSWKTQSFRQSVIAKIDEAIQMSGMPISKNSIEMENHVYQKAKSKEEYLGFVARLILHVREMNSKKGATGNAPGNAGTNNQGMPDPIGALQTLARQGTGNNQMMGMGGPGPNHQGIIPQPPANTATNQNTKTAEGSACADSLDELLIEAVKARKELYDYRIPANERSNLRKNALWAEVSNTLGGAFNPEEAKARWKYLKDNYTKARKKVKGYIPSGSAANAASGQKKPKFRFYDLMTFLNDFLETRQTVSSLPYVAESENYETFEPHEDDSNSALGFTDNSPLMQTTIDASPPLLTPTPTLVPPRTSTPRNVSPQTPLSMTSRIPATNAKKPLQTAENYFDESRKISPAKKQKTEGLQTALIEALKEPTTQTVDPLDGFLARLGEGMRRLPYRDRARLEIRFLTLLAEIEDVGANQDPSMRY